MAEKVGDETYHFEATVEHTTAKAWLVIDAMSTKQAWLPNSVGTIMRERDEDGNVLFSAPEWWCRKNGII
jgi:hypothetical protein